ncbi:hypothetical protein K474DRAFT_47604 [Panus rudis PR-1116 ss-1]|nr:hypothetical protein K474DRAFT_47604 [Panus rudis PR-1116 ss-1]
MAELTEQRILGQPIVIGVIGSTASMFCTLVSGSNVRIGGETAHVKATRPFVIDDRIIVLLEIPNLEDMNVTPRNIISGISDLFVSIYEDRVRLDGIVFLRSYAGTHSWKFGKAYYALFRELCGTKSLHNVVLAVTTWGSLTQDTLDSIERELAKEEHLYKPALKMGAMMVRHDNTIRSGCRILRSILTNIPIRPHELEDRVQSLSRQVTQLMQERETWKTLQSQIEKNGADIETLHGDVESVQWEAQASKLAIQELRTAEAEIREWNEHQNHARAVQQEELDAIRSLIDGLETTITKQRQIFETQRAEDLEQYLAEVDACRKDISVVQDLCQNNEGLIQGYKGDLQSLKDAVTETQTHQGDLQGEFKRFQETISDLQSRLDAAMAENTELRTMIAQRQEEGNAQQSELETLRKDTTELRAEIAEKEKEKIAAMESSKREVEELKAQGRRYEKMLEHMSESMNVLRTQLESVQETRSSKDSEGKRRWSRRLHLFS